MKQFTLFPAIKPRHTSLKPTAMLLAIACALGLSGCATLRFDDSIEKVNQEANSFTQGYLALARTPPQQEESKQLAQQILAKPLAQNDAVWLSLINSPAFQAMLAQNWADTAAAMQAGQISNPSISLERMRIGAELEIGRIVSFGLMDLLTWPQRQQIAQQKKIQQQLLLSSKVIAHVTQVRQAWVKAVAAQQSLSYAKQVHQAAQVSNELASRMQQVGNFTSLQSANQQAFYADAAMQLATAQHISVASKEELIRLLGLTQEQAKQLLLPEQLPTLPAKVRTANELGQLMLQNRLDVQLAKAQLEATAKAQGLDQVTRWTDIEMGLRRDTVFDNAEGSSDTKRGVEIAFKLPLFDSGQNARQQMNAQTLAASYQFEATMRVASSHLRETYSAYRTSYDIAKHYQDEIVPLRKIISEQNLLRYNGMLIGVFELLADSREQVASVMSAITAQQQFWLADAALQASVVGQATLPSLNPISTQKAVEEGH